MVRIGMILDKTFPPDPRVENEALALVEHGFEVFLFCLKYNQDQKNEEFSRGIEIRRAPSNQIEYKLSALAYTLPFYQQLMHKKIRRFLKANAIEVVHIHDIRIAGAAFKAARALGLPVVLDLHDNMPEIIKYYPHVQKFPGKYLISPGRWKKIEEEFIVKADKIITVSEEFREEVIGRTKIDPSKIELVPNTVRREFYQDPYIDKDLVEKYKNDFVILYLGDTGLRRGLLTAIEAVNMLKGQIKNIKLLIVGQSTTDRLLKRKVKELGIQDMVDFQGWQDISLFPSYIEASAICISPLNRNKQHDVAYANKLFQYMSFAKPLLVSNATAQEKLIRKTESGLVHLEKDATDFSSKLMALYKDKNQRQEFGLNGKNFIEKEFNWNITSKKLIQLYQEFSI